MNFSFPWRSLVLVMMAPVLHAQQAPAAAANAGGRPGNDEAIQLSPFEVSSGAVQGYATTSSTSASRVAVPITELPSSVIVINEKLIEDMLAVTAEDTLNLVGGVSAFAETQSQDMNKFSMRGYVTSTAQRDGFTDLLYGLNGGFTYTFIERMEVLKGPNAILYGQDNPGGILNLVSKRPLAKPRTKVSLMVGSYDFYRGDFDTSGRLGAEGQLGYRLSVSYSNIAGPIDHPGDSNKGFLAINPIVRYRTKNGLEVWAWTGFVRDQSPRLKRIVKGFRTPDGKGAYLLDMADDGGAHNVLTNGAKVDTDSYELGVTKSVELGPIRLDLRLLGRSVELHNQSTLVNATGGIDIYVDQAGNPLGSDGRTIDYSRVVGNLGGSYRAVAAQLSGNNTTNQADTYAADSAFTFKLGPTESKLLVFGTYDELERINHPGIDGRTYLVSSAANLRNIGAEVVGTQARIWTYPLSRAALAGVSPQTIIANANTSSAQNSTFQNNEQYSYGAIERLAFWDKRAFLVAGTRFTSIESTNRTGTGAAAKTSDETWTSSFGAVVKAYRGEKGQVALFYNGNETFVPVFAIDQRLATFGQKFPNRTVAIKEFGFKVDLLDSRLVATASWYKTNEDNVLLSEIDVDGRITGVTGRSFQLPAGKRKTDGWDVDLSANLRKGLDVVLSYGECDGMLEIGVRTSGQPSATASSLIRYEQPTGVLKGASVAWNYVWWGDSILNNRTYWTVPPGDLHTVVLGYKWRRYAFRLRVENPFDKIKARPSVNETAVGVTSHRNYRFSLDFRW